MAYSRKTLHKYSLEEFSKFCADQGWLREPVIGPYEALRMRHPERRNPLIVFQQRGGDHYTTWNDSQRMALLFIKEKEGK